MQGAIRPHALHVQCMGIADPEVVGGNALVFAAYVGCLLYTSSKPVRVTRRGVTLKIHGLELDFYTPELANLRMQDKVYLRYDPEDLSKVRVYDMEDRFLTEAPQSKLTAGYLATQEQIAELMAAKRKAEKAVREYGRCV